MRFVTGAVCNQPCGALHAYCDAAGGCVFGVPPVEVHTAIAEAALERIRLHEAQMALREPKRLVPASP